MTEEREDRPRGLETWTSIWSWARRETCSSLLRQHGSSQEIQRSYEVVFPWVGPKVGAVSHPISVLMTSSSRWGCCPPFWRCLNASFGETVHGWQGLVCLGSTPHWSFILRLRGETNAGSKETEKQKLWIMRQYWRMEFYIMCWVEGAGNEKYVAHNPSNPGDYIRYIQCGTGMVRVGNREEV